MHCHGPDEQDGDLRVDTLTADFAKRENAATWIEVRDRINLGEMPPKEDARLPVEKIEANSPRFHRRFHC